MTNKRFYLAVLGLAGTETIFWLYTFYYIDAHANLRGDGLEWLAEVPMTLIFLCGVLPALVLGIAGLWFSVATMIAALFAGGALVADAVIWTQILGEFAHKTAH